MTIRRRHYKVNMLIGCKDTGYHDSCVTIAILDNIKNLFIRMDEYTNVLERLGFVKDGNTYKHPHSNRTYAFFIDDYTTFEFTTQDLEDIAKVFIKDGTNEL